MAGLVGVLVPLALAICICGRSFNAPLTLVRSTLLFVLAEACVVDGIVVADAVVVTAAVVDAPDKAGVGAVDVVTAGGAVCGDGTAGLADRACPGPAISIFMSIDSAGLCG
jgi:hypothetical protein